MSLWKIIGYSSNMVRDLTIPLYTAFRTFNTHEAMLHLSRFFFTKKKDFSYLLGGRLGKGSSVSEGSLLTAWGSLSDLTICGEA